MATNFLTRSRHGTVYYFRRRVPKQAQTAIGSQFVVQSLKTSERRLAVIRARSLATQTDIIFQRIFMAKQSSPSDGLSIDFKYELDIPGLGKLTIEAEPEERDAVNDAIRTTIEAHGRNAGAQPPSVPQPPSAPQKTLTDAIDEYFRDAQIGPATKATYRSKTNDLKQFFGADYDLVKLDQPEFVRYCDHVKETIKHPTTQGLYISTASSIINWHRESKLGLSAVTTKTLIPRRETPEMDDRDAFTIEQLRFIFENATQYRKITPSKFWVSIVPALLGCRIEEISQIYLKTDLCHDKDHDIWYLKFDALPDPDGVKRKSLKKLASWRNTPIHSALVRHGFVDFLLAQKKAGHSRPFEHEWKAYETDTPEGERIIKWSHPISKWGGRELEKILKKHQFDKSKLTYFHSIRHTAKAELGNAGISQNISEAICGREIQGQSADATRYEKLKRNHLRLSVEGIEPGLNKIVAMLDDVLSA
jgi:hypothetical protein